MNRKSVINILCALSVMIAVGIAVWITLTAHTPHTMDDYINHQYLIWSFPAESHSYYVLSAAICQKYAEDDATASLFYSMESGKPQVSLHSHSNSQFSISLLIQLISIPTI